MINSMSLLKSLLVAVFATLMAFSARAQDDGLGLDTPSDDAPPAASAPAQDSNPANSKPLQGTPVQTTKDGKPKRTTIDFEDELVEGKTKNPELFYLLQKRQFNYKRLIRLRENFLPEMRKTSEEISGRKGSGD